MRRLQPLLDDQMSAVLAPTLPMIARPACYYCPYLARLQPAQWDNPETNDITENVWHCSECNRIFEADDQEFIGFLGDDNLCSVHSFGIAFDRRAEMVQYDRARSAQAEYQRYNPDPEPYYDPDTSGEPDPWNEPMPRRFTNVDSVSEWVTSIDEDDNSFQVESEVAEELGLTVVEDETPTIDGFFAQTNNANQHLPYEWRDYARGLFATNDRPAESTTIASREELIENFERTRRVNEEFNRVFDGGRDGATTQDESTD